MMFDRENCGDPKHQHPGPCITLPERVELKIDDLIHVYEFNDGCVPLEMVFSTIPKDVIVFKREKVSV